MVRVPLGHSRCCCYRWARLFSSPHRFKPHRCGPAHKLECDALVNPTSESLNDPHPVPREILLAGGPDLRAELAQLQSCRTGETRVTDGFQLPVRYVHVPTLGGSRKAPADRRALVQGAFGPVLQPCQPSPYPLNRHVIHTVGPRYNPKYITAAESSLYNCYRKSLESFV